MANSYSAELEPVDTLSIEALIERYLQGVHTLDARVLKLSDEQQDTFFRAEAGVGRWSCRVLVGHLADAELLMTWRMRRVVSEERPVLTPWDHEALIDAHVYAGEHSGADRPLAGSIGVIHTLRLWMGDWLRTLDAGHWNREGLHPEIGPLTLRQMLEMATIHLEHHARFLPLKIERLESGRTPPNASEA